MRSKTLSAIVSSLWLLSAPAPAFADPVPWSEIWPTLDSEEKLRLGNQILSGIKSECAHAKSGCDLIPTIEAHVTANAWYSDTAPGLTKRCLSRAREHLATLLPAATREAGKALFPAPTIDFWGVNDRIVAETDTETGVISLHPKACASGDAALAFTIGHEIGHLVISARGTPFDSQRISWELKAEEVAASAIGIRMLTGTGIQFDVGSSPVMRAHLQLAEAIND